MNRAAMPEATTSHSQGPWDYGYPLDGKLIIVDAAGNVVAMWQAISRQYKREAKEKLRQSENPATTNPGQ